MLIFPAIDILGGKAVRLFQGDYDNKEEYGTPLSFAKQFQNKGATHLHLVDLDGAKLGEPKNFDAVQAICSETSLFTEIGGGIRTEEAVVRYLDAGADRVILGTAALKEPAFTASLVARYGEKIAVGVDARNGKVSVEGWLEISDTDSYEFCMKMADIGVKHVIYTDIAKDGAQSGPNLEAYRKLAGIKELSITASGGVSSIRDLKELGTIGLYGAIIGKALYTGAIELEAAVRALYLEGVELER